MGGTEILPALQFVVQQPTVPGLPRQVLVLTDGEVTNTDEVIDLARRHASTARCFTFGIGAGASHHLVKGLARASRGAAEFIAPGERIEAKVMRQFKRVFAPAMTDVKVEWGQDGLKAASDRVPPVFDGERVRVYALADTLVAGTATLARDDWRAGRSPSRSRLIRLLPSRATPSPRWPRASASGHSRSRVSTSRAADPCSAAGAPTARPRPRSRRSA